MRVTIEKLPSSKVAYMRSIGPYGAPNIPLMRDFKKWALAGEMPL